VSPTMPKSFVELLVSDLFDELGREEIGGTSQRALAVKDLEAMSPEELLRGFARTAAVVEGFVVAAEAISPVTLMVLNDTRERVHAALLMCQEAASE
jgi:hypothetical protein